MGELTADKQARLLVIERVIEDAFEAKSESLRESFLQVYNEKLYGESFEKYCRDRWNITRQHGYNLVTEARVTLLISSSGVDMDLIKGRHLLAISKAPGEVQSEITKTVVDRCIQSGRNPTESDFKEEVDVYIGVVDGEVIGVTDDVVGDEDTEELSEGGNQEVAALSDREDAPYEYCDDSDYEDVDEEEGEDEEGEDEEGEDEEDEDGASEDVAPTASQSSPDQQAARGTKVKQGSEKNTVKSLIRMIQREVSPIVKKLDEAATLNGGRGPQYEAADKSLSEFLVAIGKMKNGDK